MATSEERLKILKMIEEGKITVDQGMQLLESIGTGKKAAPQASPSSAASVNSHVARWFRVRVTDMENARRWVGAKTRSCIASRGSQP